MPKAILIGEIEGRMVLYGKNQTLIAVDDDNDNWEDIHDWLANNLPEEGKYVRIVVMVFPGV